MSKNDLITREKILEIAKAEFLDKGFANASLRGIVKDAGVTTGSFYWYYKSKYELFDAIVESHYNNIMNMYKKGYSTFFDIESNNKSGDRISSHLDSVISILEYMYEYKVEFKILIDGSSGTRYENIIHDITVCGMEEMHKFHSYLEHIGISVKKLSSDTEHILISGMFASLFELITHDVPIDNARVCVKELYDFYMVGWMHIMDVKLDLSKTK